MSHTIDRQSGTRDGVLFAGIPSRPLTLNAAPDFGSVSGGTRTFDGTTEVLGVPDGTAGARAAISHPRALSWSGGRLTYAITARLVGQQVLRLVRFGFYDGARVAAFRLFSGALFVEYGDEGAAVTQVSRTAGFSAALPVYDPLDWHTYEVSVGLDGRITWCVDGVEVYAVTQNSIARTALAPYMHTAVEVENVGATSGAASVEVADQVWSSEEAPATQKQVVHVEFTDSPGAHVIAFAIDGDRPESRMARVSRISGVRTSTGAVAVEAFISKETPADVPAAPLPGAVVAVEADTAGLNAQTFGAGTKLAGLTLGIDGTWRELARDTGLELGLSKASVDDVTAEPTYLYIVVTTTAGTDAVGFDVEFDIE